MDTSRSIKDVLSKKEIEKISPAILKKIEKHFLEHHKQLTAMKNLYNDLRKNSEKLRHQLDKAIVEKNQLFETSAGKDTTINGLQSSNDQLVSRFCDREVKELNTEKLKETIYDLKAEITRLKRSFEEEKSDLLASVQNETSETDRLQIGLNATIEELDIANLIVSQLQKSKQLLTDHNADLAAQLDDASRVKESFKQELGAKIKLLDLYEKQINESTLLQCSADQNQINLNEKDERIDELSYELFVVSDRLKTAETDEKVLEKLFPKAAAAHRLLKGDLSLTQILSKYYDALEDVDRLEMICQQLTQEIQGTSSEHESQTEFKKLIRANEEINETVSEQDDLRKKLNEITPKFHDLKRENAKLKSHQKSLARQICNLLEIQTVTNECDQFCSFSASVSKELVTFDNIEEMQENNQKLMLKVHDLTSKLAEMEEVNIGRKCWVIEKSDLERRLSEVERTQRADEDILKMTDKQKERYKQLYYDAVRYMSKEPIKELDVVALRDTETLHVTSADVKDKMLLEVEQKLQDKIKELKNLKEEYNEYRIGGLDSVKLEFANEQINSYKKDIAIYKEQIQILEDRNQMYDKTISKYEANYKSLRDVIQNLSTAENRCEFLQLECQILIEANKNIEMKNNNLHRLVVTQDVFQSNLELSKISSERSNFEGRIQVEKQLKEQVRQSKALGRKLEEEQNRFRAEHEQRNAIQTELSKVREEVESKNQEIKNLSEKLEKALKTCESDNSKVKGNKKIKDLELQVKSKTAEIQELQLELQGKTTKMGELKLNETNLKSHILELQQEISRLNVNVPDTVSESQVREEWKESFQKLTELRKNVHIAERKYTQVVKAHASDVEKLTSSQLELEAKNTEMNQNRQELEKKVANLEEKNMELMKLVQDNSPVELTKNLRREKDITRIDILNIEIRHMSVQLEMERKKNDKLNLELTHAKSQASDVVSKTKYEELLSKMQILNDALTDSNIRLRSEKIRLEADLASNVKRLQEAADNQKKLQDEQEAADNQKKLQDEQEAADNQKKLQDDFNNLKQTNAELTLDLIRTRESISRDEALFAFPTISAVGIAPAVSDGSTSSQSMGQHPLKDSPKNTVKTTPDSNKRPLYAEGESQTNVEVSSEFYDFTGAASLPATKKLKIENEAMATNVKGNGDRNDVESTHGRSERVIPNRETVPDRGNGSKKPNDDKDTGNMKRKLKHQSLRIGKSFRNN